MPKQSDLQKLLDLEADAEAAYKVYNDLARKKEQLQRELKLDYGTYMGAVGGRPAVLHVTRSDYGGSMPDYKFAFVTQLS